MKRVFLIVLDSFGIGEMPDADLFGDCGSDTLGAVVKSEYFNMPNMRRLGLFNIEGAASKEHAVEEPFGSFCRLGELSMGKDTTIGHWEIAGVVSHKPLPTFPQGFPQELLDEFSRRTGRGVLCNRPYSGTQVIADYGLEHLKTGKLIVYTSADSVFQVAAHEEAVPVKELYRYCEIARELLKGDLGVGRVIARPFVGEYPEFTRTSNRHDFSLAPPSDTMLDKMSANGLDAIGVGKIYDIFAGKGLTEFVRIKNNNDGMQRTFEYQKKPFNGLCFVNLVDFDMLYGHRNDVDGYAKALTEFDSDLSVFLRNMEEDDVLMITADHGCDPSTPSTDHSREYVPLVIYGNRIRQGINLHTRMGFCDIAATVLDIFGMRGVEGTSFLKDIFK
ncbi:MAG: phosphopentomutase [Clostridia bacterium]|nr:phosphopentomutase [Clostridia bacterium]